MRLTLGIDIGGTTIKAALVSPGGAETAIRRVPTPRGDHSAAATIAAIQNLVKEFELDSPLDGIGVVSPGIVDESSSVVNHAVNLGWMNLPLRAGLESALNRPVTFAHDVRAGAFAESRAGAARGAATAIFVPIGTGISMATVVDGVAISSGGWAGEIGQLAVTRTAAREDQASPSLENVASASSLARRLGLPDALAVTTLVRQGDSQATELWLDAIDALAEALGWASAVVGPEVIVVGGGLAQSGALLLDPLAAALADRLGALRCPRVVPAYFGDRAALIGAGLLAHLDLDSGA